jgi:ribosomal protein L7/L12
MSDKVTLETEVVNALQSGRKIEAIKQLRAIRGIGLKDAKELVDLYSSQNDIVISSVSGGSAKTIIKIIRFIVMVAFIAFVADKLIQ